MWIKWQDGVHIKSYEGKKGPLWREWIQRWLHQSIQLSLVIWHYLNSNELKENKTKYSVLQLHLSHFKCSSSYPWLVATILNGTTIEHSHYCRQFSWAVSLRKNWENPNTFNKKEGGGGVGLRGNAASKHLMDFESRGEGKENQAGDTWTERAQGRLTANEFTSVNNNLGISGEKGRSGTQNLRAQQNEIS